MAENESGFSSSDLSSNLEDLLHGLLHMKAYEKFMSEKLQKLQQKTSLDPQPPVPEENATDGSHEMAASTKAVHEEVKSLKEALANADTKSHQQDESIVALMKELSELKAENEELESKVTNDDRKWLQEVAEAEKKLLADVCNLESCVKKFKGNEYHFLVEEYDSLKIAQANMLHVLEIAKKDLGGRLKALEKELICSRAYSVFLDDECLILEKRIEEKKASIDSLKGEEKKIQASKDLLCARETKRTDELFELKSEVKEIISKVENI